MRATSTATQCSAALPTIATTTAPMKNSLRPTDLAASEIDPTRISDMPPTATPPSASASTERRVLHGVTWSFSAGGLNRPRWLRSENMRPAP